MEANGAIQVSLQDSGQFGGRLSINIYKNGKGKEIMGVIQYDPFN